MPQCSDPGCAEYRFDADAALREGWGLIDDEPYCPLHHSGASWRARKAEQRERIMAAIEKRVAGRRDAEAKIALSAADYHAWDQFQGALADYHKKHGKLAHPAVRMLDHRHWLEIHQATGAIDVEEAVRFTEAAEKSAKSAPERLARGI